MLSETSEYIRSRSSQRFLLCSDKTWLDGFASLPLPFVGEVLPALERFGGYEAAGQKRRKRRNCWREIAPRSLPLRSISLENSFRTASVTGYGPQDMEGFGEGERKGRA